MYFESKTTVSNAGTQHPIQQLLQYCVTAMGTDLNTSISHSPKSRDGFPMSFKAESSPGSLVQHLQHSDKYICHFVATKKVEAVTADGFYPNFRNGGGKIFYNHSSFWCERLLSFKSIVITDFIELHTPAQRCKLRSLSEALKPIHPGLL